MPRTCECASKPPRATPCLTTRTRASRSCSRSQPSSTRAQPGTQNSARPGAGGRQAEIARHGAITAQNAPALVAWLNRMLDGVDYPQDLNSGHMRSLSLGMRHRYASVLLLGAPTRRRISDQLTARPRSSYSSASGLCSRVITHRRRQEDMCDTPAVRVSRGALIVDRSTRVGTRCGSGESLLECELRATQ